MAKLVLSAAFLAALSILQASSVSAQECKLQLVSAIPMSVNPIGESIVPLASNGGRKLNFMIDTGSPFSMVTSLTVKELGLETAPFPRGRVVFYGKRPVVQTTRVPWMANNRGWTVGVFPGGLRGAHGLLGLDILGVYDFEFDFYGGKLNLFKPHDCNGNVVYWPSSASVRVPFNREGPNGHIILNATLDGKKVTAMLDTGATRTVWSMEVARRHAGSLQVSNESRNAPAPQAISGFSGEADEGDDPDSFTYRFKTLDFSGITINNPDIVLVPNSESGLSGRDARQIILGRNILRRLRIYVAYKEQALYITPATTPL